MQNNIHKKENNSPGENRTLGITGLSDQRITTLLRANIYAPDGIRTHALRFS